MKTHRRSYQEIVAVDAVEAMAERLMDVVEAECVRHGCDPDISSIVCASICSLVRALGAVNPKIPTAILATLSAHPASGKQTR